MNNKVRRYALGSGLIKYIRFDDFIAFGMIVSRTHNFYIVEWYLGNGNIETESLTGYSIKYYKENYKQYILGKLHIDAPAKKE